MPDEKPMPVSGSASKLPSNSTMLPALLKKAPQMSFYRFCELLELSAPHLPPLGSADSPVHEPVRFRSRQGLGFPYREVDAIEYDAEDPTATPSVRTTFLGLYGVDARMPAYFSDEIAQGGERAEPLAAFLDMFHHRVVTQFYRVWRKYRYPAGFRRDGDDDISQYLLSLAGLGIGGAPTRQRVGVRKLLSMLGLAGQKTRTAEGLAGILQHAVPDAQILVTEFYPVWIHPDTVEPAPLGEGCLLGRGFYDRANAIRIVIRPQSRESVLGLMPGEVQHEQVMTLPRFYLGYEARAHVQLEVDPSLLPDPLLGGGLGQLGYSTRLPAKPGGRSMQDLVRIQLGAYDAAAMVH